MPRTFGWTASLALILLTLTGFSPPNRPAAPVVWIGGATPGDWNDGANWVGGNPPGATDIAVFDATGAGNAPPSLNSPAVLEGIQVDPTYAQAGAITLSQNLILTADLTLDPGSATTLDLGGSTLTVQGNAPQIGRDVQNGIVQFVNPGAVALGLNGGSFLGGLEVGAGGSNTTATLQTPSALNADALTVDGGSSLSTAATGASVAVTGPSTINGTFTLGGSVFDGNDLVSGSGTFDASGGGNVNVAAGLTVTTYTKGAGTLTFDGGGNWSGASDFGVVVVTAGAITAGSSLLVDTLDINDGLLDLSGNTLDVNGLITVGDGIGAANSAVLQSGAGGIFVNGGLSIDKGNDGDYDPNGGTLTFDGTGNWSGAGDDFGAVVVSSGTTTVQSDVSLTTLTINAGTVSVGVNDLDVNGLLSGSGTLDATGGGNVNTAGGLTVTTYTKGAGTLTFDGAGSWSGASDFGAVVITTGLVTAGSDLTTDALTINGITFILGGNDLDVNGLLSGSGTLDATGGGNVNTAGGLTVTTYTKGAGTLTFDGGGTWGIGAGSDYGTVIIDAVATVTLGNNVLMDSVFILEGTLDLAGSNLDVNGQMTLGNGVGGTATLQSSSAGGTLNVFGGFALDADGLYSPPNMTLTFDGTGTWSGSGQSFGAVVISAGTITSTSHLLADNLTVSGGTLDLVSNANDLTVSGDVDLSGGALTAGPLNTLTFTGSGTRTFDPGANTLGAMTVSGTSTLQVQNNPLTLSGTLSVQDGTTLEVQSSAGSATLNGITSVGGGVSGTLDVNVDTTFNSGLTVNAGGTFQALGDAITIRFDETALTTVSGTITINGAAANVITLRSVVNGNDWDLDLTGATQTFQDVQVKDSDANPGATATATGASIDFGNNSNWTGLGSSVLTWVGTGAAGDWDNASNWTPSFVPVAGSTVIFDATGAANPPPSVNTPATLGGITIDSSYSQALPIQIDGNLTLSGDLTADAGSATSIDLNGNTLTLGGNATIGRPVSGGGSVIFNNVGISTVSGTATLGTLLQVGQGGSNTTLQFTPTTSLSVDSLILDGGSTLSLGIETIRLIGTSSTPLSGAGTLDATSGTVDYAGINGGGNVAIFPANYGNLTVSGAGETYDLTGTTATFLPSFLTGGTLTVNGQNFTISDNSQTPLTVAGGTLDATSGTVEYTSLALGNVSIVPTTYDILRINQAAETFDLIGATIVTTLDLAAGTLSTNGQDLTVGGAAVVAGTLDVDGGTTTLQGALSGTGSVTQTGGILNLADTSIDLSALVYTSTGGTTRLTAGVPISLSVDATDSFFNLVTTPGTTVAMTGSTAGLDVDGDLTLGDDFTLLGGAATVAGNLEVSAGVLNLNAQNLTVTGTTEIDGTLDTGGGAPTVDLDGNLLAGSTGTLTVGSGTLRLSGSTLNLSNLAALSHTGGTIEFDGAATPQVFSPPAGTNLFNVTLNKSSPTDTVRFTAPTTILNSTTLTAGTLDLQADTTFGGQVTVQAAGALSTTTAATTHTFQNGLVINPGGQVTFSASAIDVVFFEGTTVNVGGSFTVSGLSGPANYITLRDQDPLGVGDGPGGGQDWLLTPTGTVSVTHARIQDSDASPGATAASSLDLGGNTNWNFPAKTTSWTGGGGDDNWSTAGNWDLGPPNSGDTVTFTNAVGGTSTMDMAGLDLAALTLSTGFTGTLSLGNDLTVSGATTVDTGTFGNGASILTTQDLAIGAAGTYSEGTGNTQVSGNLTVDPAATWTNNPTGTLTFTGAGVQTWNGGDVNLGNVATGGSGTTVQLVGSAARVTFVSIALGDTLDLNNQLLTATSGVSVSGTLQDSTGVAPGTALDTVDLTLNVSGTQSEGPKDARISGSLTLDPGATFVNHVTGSIVFDGGGPMTLDAGGHVLGEIRVEGGSIVQMINTDAQVTTLDILGADTFDLNGLQLTINGDGVTTTPLTIAPGGTYTNSGTTVFAGTSPGDTVIPTAGATYENIVLAGAETYRPEGDLSVSQDLTIQAPSILNTSEGAVERMLSVGGTLLVDGTLLSGTDGATTLTLAGDVDLNGTMNLAGGNAVNVDLSGNFDGTAGLLLGGTGTFDFNGVGAQTLTLDGAETFNDVDVTNAAGISVATGTFDIDGTLTLQTSLVMGNNTLQLAGDFDGTGGILTFGGTGTLNLDGAGQTLTIDANSDTFDSVNVNQSAPGDVVAVNGVGVQTFTTGTLTVTQGILDLNVGSTSSGAATTIGANGTIRSDNVAGTIHQFLGNDGTNSLVLTGGTLSVTSPGAILVFLEGFTVSLDATSTFFVSGALGQEITLRDDAPGGSIWTLDAATGATTTLHRVNLQDSTATGPSAPLTATHSIDLGGNTNWSFTAGGANTVLLGPPLTGELNALSVQFTIVLTVQPTDDVVIPLSTSDPSEGSVAPPSVTFTSGNWNVPQPVTVTGTDDALVDGDVAYSILLEPATSTDLAYDGVDFADVALTNQDDEVPGTVQLTSATYAAGEGAGSILITVTRSIGKLGAVSVDYATSDGTASDGSDYTGQNGTMTFPAGDATAQTFSIPILPDSLVEGDETVDITLSGVTGGATLGAPATAVLTISDAAGRIALASSTASVSENGGSVNITVVRTGGSGGLVTAMFDTRDATATAGADYVAVSQLVTFPDGDATPQAVTITIQDDALVEGDETVNLALSAPTGGATLGGPATGTLTIVDHEASAGVLAFERATWSEVENQPTATVTVVRTDGAVGTVMVDVQSADGTATAGADYTATAPTLTFGDGVTSQSFTVTILDDVDVEGDETVLLTLSNPTGGAVLGAPDTSVLSILDHEPGEPGTLELSLDAVYVSEDGGTALLTLVRTGGTGGSVSVDVATNDLSATAGADYTAVSETIALADGVTGASIIVPILDDAIVEGDESLTVTLSSPTGGATLGILTTAILTIVDREPGVPGDLGFDPALLAVAENDGAVKVRVVRQGGTTGTVTVQLATGDLTATAPGDYGALLATLVFGDGEFEKCVFISVVDDTTFGGDKTFDVTLSGPTGGAAISGTNPITVTIFEDDAVPGKSSGSKCGLTGLESLLFLFVAGWVARGRLRCRA